MEDKDFVYDDNEPLCADLSLIVPLERYHSNHDRPDCKAYKLLGIYLDDKLILITTPIFSATSLTDPCSVWDELKIF